MAGSTLVHPRDRGLAEEPAPPRPSVADGLVAMGSVLHRLDYGGRIAAVGPADGSTASGLAAAYPLAEVECTATPGGLPPGHYDLVCFLGGLAELDDPVGAARAALQAVRPTGAVMVVEPTRTDAFVDGPIAVGAWLARAGAARVRIAHAAPHRFVLDARSTH